MSKTLTCRQCGHVFFSSKFKPFCSASCRHAATAEDPTTKKSHAAYPEGAINEASNTLQDH